MYIMKIEKQMDKTKFRYIVLRADTDTVGTDAAEFVLYSIDTPNTRLDAEAWDYGLSNAEMYGIYPIDAAPEDYDEDSEEAGWRSDTYSEGIEGWWEEYDHKKHAGLVVGSASAEQIFSAQEARCVQEG